MVIVPFKDEHEQPIERPLALFPAPAPQAETDLPALIEDLFAWLESAWQLPVFITERAHQTFPRPATLTDDIYTLPDLVRLCGYSYTYVSVLLQSLGIRRSGFAPRHGRGGVCGLYQKHDLAPFVMQWEWKQVQENLDDWWLRFFPPACGKCASCRTLERMPVAQQFHCTKHPALAKLRMAFTAFLKEIHHTGSIAAWWRIHQCDAWGGFAESAWGIVLIYLLDRRWISLSLDELMQLDPVVNKHHHDLTRLWRHRHPEEYTQFVQAMNAATYTNPQLQTRALTMLVLFLLLKHGLSGLTALRRPLSTEEIEQACQEQRLVTRHLGCGVFLPYPLNPDIQVGHVALDEIRFALWRFAADREERNPGAKTPQWHKGPHGWQQMTVSIIEQALAAPVYAGATSILSRRPEIEGQLFSPWYLAHQGRLDDTGYALLPHIVQEQIMSYLTYCHREQHVELTTLRSMVRNLVFFFTWIRRQGKLASYPDFSLATAQDLFRNFAQAECTQLQPSSRKTRLRHLARFFAALSDLGYPVPPGSRLLYTLAMGLPSPPRMLPREEIMDRVFQDGVCQLSYDPLARLALTIQYYCGTRVTETCDLHLFCILEDRAGHAYLLIPRGKTKTERPFPIVELGMGPLLEYMDEVISMRLSPDGISRTLGKTNYRYLGDEPERGGDWHYLFDRVPEPGKRGKHKRLSSARVALALQEALHLAAQINPSDLFQEETYHPCCQQRRRAGQCCRYFCAREGITICPWCGSPLSGKRGARCSHLLEKDVECDGVADEGAAFCPKCETALAEFLPITPHVFRHNSVSRAHRAGVSLAHNMRLHGHQTVPMHLRYLHVLLEETTEEVRHLFAEKRLRDVRQLLGSSSGKVVEGGIAYTVSLEQYLGMTLQRALKRRTYGIWGGFWAGALAQQGIASPLSIEDEIVIPEETYEHTVAQYWYEALGLAVSEVAFEQVTGGKWRADVPSFLDREKIERLVQFHLQHVQDGLRSALGLRLMETDILDQRRFLEELAEKLRPWWQPLGTIEQLADMFAPGGENVFQKQVSTTEPTS